MRSEARRAGEVVQRLRDFFRTGATRLEDVALGSLVEAAAEHYRDKAAAAGIAFTVNEVPDIHLLADRLQLEVVLRNLLSNAFDAVQAQATGPRWVSLRADVPADDQVCICVEDSGLVFESFYSGKSNGMGLGLAISRAIAEAHGGSLTGEVAGHGQFRLVLPIREAITP
jgi:signal transduction histidine kinase